MKGLNLGIIVLIYSNIVKLFVSMFKGSVQHEGIQG